MKNQIIYTGIFAVGFYLVFLKLNGIYEGWWTLQVGSVIIAVTLAIIQGRSHAGTIIKGVHWKQVIVRVIVLIVITAYALVHTSMPFLIPAWGIYLPSVPLIAYMLMVWSAFFIVFDPVVAVNKGKKWNYVGKEAWYDRLQRRLNFRFFAVEIVAFLLSVYLFNKFI